MITLRINDHLITRNLDTFKDVPYLRSYLERWADKSQDIQIKDPLIDPILLDALLPRETPEAEAGKEMHANSIRTQTLARMTEMYEYLGVKPPHLITISGKSVQRLIESNNNDVLEIILAMNPLITDLDKVKSGFTLLTKLAWVDPQYSLYIRFARYILDMGVDVNASDEDSNTPLHNACNGIAWPDEAIIDEEQPYTFVRLLLDRGADVDARNESKRTPLLSTLVCAGYSDVDPVDLVALLLQHKADINVRDVDGMTALSIAARYSRKMPQTFNLLLEAKPTDLNSALREAAVNTADKNSTVGTVRRLLKAGAVPESDIIVKCVFDKVPIKVIKLLIQAGANVNAFDSNSQTALRYAAVMPENEGLHYVKVLVARGARTDVYQNGCSCGRCGLPIQLASLKGNTEVVKYLEQFEA